MKRCLALLLLVACGDPVVLREGAPDPRPPFLSEDLRCKVGGAFVLPDVGQRRCDAYRCSSWEKAGVVVWERRERTAYQCRKTSPVPQNGAL